MLVQTNSTDHFHTQLIAFPFCPFPFPCRQGQTDCTPLPKHVPRLAHGQTTLFWKKRSLDRHCIRASRPSGRISSGQENVCVCVKSNGMSVRSDTYRDRPILLGGFLLLLFAFLLESALILFRQLSNSWFCCRIIACLRCFFCRLLTLSWLVLGIERTRSGCFL